MTLSLKLFGGVFIALSGLLVGIFFSSRLTARREFLTGFISFLSALETNIRYRSDDIITLIKFSCTSTLVDIFSSKSVVFKEFWNYSINSIPKTNGLTSEDIKLLYDFGELLGTTDTEGQLNHIALYKELFQTELDKAVEDCKNKSKLYKILGFFSGAAVALILI